MSKISISYIHPSNDMSGTPESLEALFTYHAPTGDQPERYTRINDAAKYFAKVVAENCPPCADRTTAIRLIRNARMTANSAIALEQPT